ncbi:MAG TPA: FlgD immunoglobulin-like domain containing protein, partial [candidate division Zixibacteria bacterium]|nr:FlgD immunoglobulin-like domain containing protein [candidate division Zixibacteria bacterium]
VPAVPGQQVVVPVDIANSCDLHAVYVPFTWDGDNVIYLDSIKFNEGLLAGIANKFVSIDNDGWMGEFGFEADISEVPIPAGHYHLADMYFSVSPVTPQGVYAVTPGLVTTTFTRNCSDFGEIINPVIPGGGGNIIVDTTNVYVCGYVVDEDGVGIWGAQVELWESYPCEGPVQTTLTNGDGAYAFTNFSLGSFDLYAWKRGNDSTTWNDAYYPNNVHVNFGENGIMIELRWLDELVPSDQWVDYFCSENTYFNCALPIGSVVEVWDEDNVLCGRQFVREAGNYRFMPVYRDSSGSVEDEGAVTGDNLRFYINGVQALTFGNTLYPEVYTQLEVCLAGGARLTKECLLNTGWNLVSWNLDTDTDAIADVLSSLNGCIEVVLGYEQGGLTYVPGMDIFNTLTAADHLSGYWIRLGDDCNHTLEISGVPVEQDTPIPVNSRWNLVSYLPNDVHDITDALYSLDGNLQIAYTYDGTPLVYVPGQGTFNTLTEMEPCFGYWLKLDHSGVLTYPPASGVAPKVEAGSYTASLSDKHGPVEPTRNWVNLYSYNLTLDSRPVTSGDIITAHSSNSTVIGHFAMKESGTFGFMPVYADADGESVAGITKGGTFTLQVNGVKTKEEFTWSEQGGLIEVAALTTGAGDNNLPESYVLEQNYPNPFNPSTTINFALPVASQARLEIFNLLGQLVATPFDAHAEAGAHEVVWDGRTLSGETASSGIYLYRLTAGHYVKTLKMTLVK